MIRLQIATQGLKALERRYKAMDRELSRGNLRAVNKTLQGARTDAVAEVGRLVTAKKKDIRAAVGTRRASSASPTAFLERVGRRSIPLEGFRVRPGKTAKRRPALGLTVQVGVRGGAEVREGTFWARGRIYKRKGKGRFPILRQWGPGPWLFLRRGRRARRRVVEKVSKRLAVNMRREARYTLMKLQGRA